MQVKRRGRKTYVEFTMHNKEFTMHNKEQEIMEEEESKQPIKDETKESVINLLTDSDDSDTEDMLVPEILMNLTADSIDSDVKDMPVPEVLMNPTMD